MTQQTPDMPPRLARATWDAEREVSVLFAEPLRMKEWPAERFELLISQAPSAGGENKQAPSAKRGDRTAGRAVAVVSTKPILPKRGTCIGYTLTTADPLENMEYTVKADGLGAMIVRPGRILQDPDRYGDASAKMGAEYSPTQTTFRVFAPMATGVRVVVADAAEGSARAAEHDMKPAGRGLWIASVSGDLEGKFYAYKLAGREFDPNREITDVCATCTQEGAARSLIVDSSKTDPPGFRATKVPTPTSMADVVIYEAHVRDFSIAASSGVERKGGYLGLIEPGTHLPDDATVKTGLDHLVELGITHVQLLPIQVFERAPNGYDWGYMPVSYNSPQGWYASSAAGSARIREFKSAVQGLHTRGIGVIMDVVYNHTAPAAGFDKLVPGYYYRFTPAGRHANGSGCGNEFNSSAPMARKFIIDSLKHWVSEYQVDGFRFDIMALIDNETLAQVCDELRKLRPGILLYGEPWAAGPTEHSPLSDKSYIRGTGVGAFNDEFRDAIKGDPDRGPGAFVQTGEHADVIAKGLAGSIEIWTRDPVDSINYFEAHDNLTAWDKLLQSVPKASETDRKRMMRLASLTLLTAQGVPFLHAGQEFCRTKGGNRNSYNAGDAVNALDWALKASNRVEFEYTRGLIALRKAHPVLRLRTGDEVKARVRFDKPPAETCVVYRVEGKGVAGESAETLLVLLNGDNKEHAFKLPAGAWKMHADADRASVTPLGELDGKVSVPAHTGVLLIQE
jgi:pullulanase